MSEPEPDGGDPACWLDQVCPACGAIPVEPDHRCVAAADPDSTG